MSINREVVLVCFYGRDCGNACVEVRIWLKKSVIKAILVWASHRSEETCAYPTGFEGRVFWTVIVWVYEQESSHWDYKFGLNHQGGIMLPTSSTHAK